MVFACLFAYCLIIKERHYQLPATPAKGHGVILLLFFTMTFICQNVALINLNADDWWFQMKNKQDKIEMGLFITRYVITLLLFVLSLKAPGIQSIENENEENLLNNEEESNVS